jgi:polysaccharide biosynthesis protein PslH
MKILQLTARIPYPPADGGAIDVFTIASGLARRGHTIRMVSLSRTVDAPPAGLLEVCSLRIVVANTSHSARAAIAGMLSGRPYLLEKYSCRAMLAALDEEVEQGRFDVVHADHLVMAPYAVYLKERHGLPVVLRQQNVESVLWSRYAHDQRNPVLKLFAGFEAWKLRRLEPRLCALCDACVMISANDERIIRAMNDHIRSFVIPAGMRIPETSPERAATKRILFLSTLSWEPNVRGFEWFVDKVLPRVLEHEPDALVDIVGKGASARLASMSHPHVRFVGFVDDVAPWIRNADVCIVPLFTGSGMRIKILEFLAYGKAVVTTRVGAEGISVRHGEELIIADTPEEFASGVALLLRDGKTRERLGQKGRDLVKSQFDPGLLAGAFEKVYESIRTGTHT